MPQEISMVKVNSRPLAAVRATTILSRWPREFMHSLDKVYEAVKAGQIRQAGQNVMVYYPRTDGLVDIDCGVETAGKFPAIGEVMFCETPAGSAVTTAHIGPYERLGASHSAIVAWSRERDHRLSGICWEIYGDWEEDPAKLRTDIFHLVG